MANWKALNWAESLTAGGPTMRAVLDKIALRVDDKFELYSSAPRIAALCELSPKPMRRALNDLESKGLITVVRRIRANRAEGTPVTLLNHPEAPHLNGKPVVLDHEGKFLYPQNPQALADADITWISANTLGRAHPKDETNGGVVGETRGGWSERPGGVVGETTHGGDGETTLNPLPRGSTQPATRAPECESAESEEGGETALAGGGADEREEQGGTDEPGEREHAWLLLSTLDMPKGPAYRPSKRAIAAVERALSARVAPELIERALLNGLDDVDVRTPARVVDNRLPDVEALIAAPSAEAESQPQQSASDDQAGTVPPICGACDAKYASDPVTARMVYTDDGRMRRCPQCHPSVLGSTAGSELSAEPGTGTDELGNDYFGLIA